MKAKVNLENIWAYIQGNIRYRLWYSPFKFLIPKHIRQQIAWRITIMDKECYDNGVCKLCGCETTALQMANKKCDKPCYPEMHSERIWYAVKPLYDILWRKDRDLFYIVIKKD